MDFPIMFIILNFFRSFQVLITFISNLIILCLDEHLTFWKVVGILGLSHLISLFLVLIMQRQPQKQPDAAFKVSPILKIEYKQTIIENINFIGNEKNIFVIVNINKTILLIYCEKIDKKPF